MFGKRIKLFSLLGFQVSIDLSWIIIAVLVVWTLSTGTFPFWFEDLPASAYWIMGAAGAAGLFLSIIVHEFSHSLVARRYGIPIKGITLFLFGGVAEMEDEPPSAKSELLMAAAGPVTSILIALAFFGLYHLGAWAGWPPIIVGVALFLAMINGILAAFNLLPAFPLDGGRILRSILWSAKKNLKWATRVASWIGSGFGVLLIVLGVIDVLSGNFIGGMWWFLIGLFLQNAASSSYRQVLVRRALEGEPVRRFMRSNPITVQPTATLEDLVENYVYKYHHKLYPVVEHGKLLSCVTTKELKNVPREDWKARTVGEIAVSCSPENTVSPDTDAVKALSRLHRNRASRLMVTDNGTLLGIVSLKDLLEFISLKVELEEA